MNLTAIGWTDFSANPLKYRAADGRIVWACEKLSSGCKHCYAADLTKRWNRGAEFNAAEMAKLTPFLADDELRRMRTARQIKGVPVSGSRCFLADMTDLYGAWVPDDLLHRLYSDTLEIRTDVVWQVLTKRSERLADYLHWRYQDRIPPRHIHHGVSVENREAMERLDDLAHAPSAVRWVSFEPLLEELGDLSPWLLALDWCVIGGESGPQYRRVEIAAMRSIAEQFVAAGKPVFVKQRSARLPGQPTGDPWLDSLKQFPDPAGDRVSRRDQP